MASIDVYPDPHIESTSVDGCIYGTSAVSWAAVKALSAGAGHSDNTIGSNYPVASKSNAGLPAYNLYRLFFLFDTSAIGSGQAVTAATMNFRCRTTVGYPGNAFTAHVVASSPASNTDLVNGDFDQVSFTSFGSYDIPSSADATVYPSFTLNASGKAAIAITGVSKFAVITAFDLNNDSSEHDVAIDFYHADTTGTTNDPKLSITYSAVPAGISTYDTVATASISTHNSMAWSGTSSII